MSFAVKTAGLGKKYRLGETHSRKTLRETIQSAPRQLLGLGSRRSQEEFWALKDFDLEVQAGEVLGIVGANGAGKSTLLKLLSRITEPTAGRIEIQGRVASLLEVGAGFHSELTGKENVYLNGSILGMTRAEIRSAFDEIVDFAGVEKFLDTPVKRYSSGMRVRLAFAVAAHLEPEILIIDEVLAVGDAAFQKKCLNRMDDVATSGRTVLFVSHQLPSLQSLCTRGIQLRDGEKVFEGTIGDTITNYLSEMRDNWTGGDLSEMPRTGSGEVKLTRYWLEDEDGVPVDSVASGAAATICLKYQRNSTEPVEPISVGLKFANSLFRLSVFKSCDQNQFFEFDQQSGVIRARFERLALAPGQFVLAAWLHRDAEIVDKPDQPIGEFTVTPGDFYDEGKPLAPDSGPILLDGQWTQTKH
ncbi:MAG: ABC transporter ATP-binding protein [Verrucomicrobiota bacterium]